MSLARLRNATLILASDALYFKRIRYWVDKGEMLTIALEDLERLIMEYLQARNTAPKYELDPRISLPEPRPRIRLAMTVEAICSCVYAMTEIAANFANHLTAKGNPEGQIPRSFRSLKEQVRARKFAKLSMRLGDLAWHDTLHTMRTEWAHFSTIFIGEENDKLLACGADLRYPSDKKYLKSTFQISLSDVRVFALECLASLDGFAAYLVPLAIAKHDLSAPLRMPVLDQNGMPVLTQDARFEIRQTTVGAQLVELGLGDVIQELAGNPPTR